MNDQCEYKATCNANLSKHRKSNHEGVSYECNQSKHEGVIYSCDQSEFCMISTLVFRASYVLPYALNILQFQGK